MELKRKMEGKEIGIKMDLNRVKKKKKKEEMKKKIEKIINNEKKDVMEIGYEKEKKDYGKK